MSHNRREPFDQPLLLEKCLRDIRNLFLMNPGDEFESQTPSSSSVATSYTTASFIAPQLSHLSHPVHTSTVTTVTITPSSAQMMSQPVKPTAAASAKSVYGVMEEEAELRHKKQVSAHTRAASPTRRQECHKKDQYAWQSVRSKKRSNKWKEAPKHQQYSKPPSKPSHKHEKDSSKSNVQEDNAKEAQKRPNPTETPKPAPKRKRCPQCPIKSCREEQSCMRRHVIQEHLPTGSASTGMELAQRMTSL